MSKKGVAAGPSAHPTLVFICVLVMFLNRLFQQERFNRFLRFLVSLRENVIYVLVGIKTFEIWGIHLKPHFYEECK